jgi:hypothetical protein
MSKRAQPKSRKARSESKPENFKTIGQGKRGRPYEGYAPAKKKKGTAKRRVT